jgi:hypothetical protein
MARIGRSKSIFWSSEDKYLTKLYLNIQSVSVMKTSQLVLYREIIAVCSEIHAKHTNTLRGQNVELLDVKPGGT